MAHFAKVVNGIVTRVVTAGDDGQTFLGAIEPGTWIKTSFNTRGGLHYGSDGLPDGLPALRKNFASVGGRYDESADAFYSEAPTLVNNQQFELNADTYLWQHIQPNTVAVPDDHDVNYRLWISPRTATLLTPRGVSNVLNSVGIILARSPADATHMFGSSDVELSSTINDPGMAHLAPMSQQALFNLTDRIGQQSIGVAVIPAVLPRSAADLEGKFTGPVFVKRRSTLTKDNSAFAYSRWSSVEQFIDATDTVFWSEQLNSTNPNGAFVVQPALAERLDIIDMFVSINARSELITWAAQYAADVGVNEYRTCRPYDNVDTIRVLDEELKLLAMDQSLGAGIHCISYTQYGGRWCLLDWNLRVSGQHFNLFAASHPIYAQAIAHMVGISNPVSTPVVVQPHYEVRYYKARGLPVARGRDVARHGMYVRSIENGVIARIAGIGSSKIEIDTKFAEFETWLDTVTST